MIVEVDFPFERARAELLFNLPFSYRCCRRGSVLVAINKALHQVSGPGLVANHTDLEIATVQADAKLWRRFMSTNLAKPMETVGQYPFVLCALAVVRRPTVHHQLPRLRRPRRRDHPLHLPPRPRVVLVSPAEAHLSDVERKAPKVGRTRTSQMAWAQVARVACTPTRLGLNGIVEKRLHRMSPELL